MKILTAWLRHYLPSLTVSDRQLADDLTLRGIAVEGVHDLGPNNGHLFEMDITTNRVDAMNHYGIAREAATIYNLPLLPLLAAEENADPVCAGENARISAEAPQNSHAASQPLPVRIEAPTLCGRFTAQVLRDVAIRSSTGLIADYFRLLGQKQISNAVDASNFVLLGMGHPTHAFDLDKVQGGIVVRLARRGERLKLLDGSERTLELDDLVVADEVKPLGLAGVMGGYDSMITAETRNILVEAAWFDPASIRRSARRHGLHTDASHRFERGADFNGCPTANRLVCELILESKDGQRAGHLEGSLIDLVLPEIAARTANRPPIRLSVQQVQRHLGSTMDPEGLTSGLIHQYLTALGCILTAAPSGIKKTGMVNPVTGNPARKDPGVRSATSMSAGTENFDVQLPSWRLDLEREIDLIEEVARVYGYNRFANTLPTPGIVLAHPLAAKEAAVRNRLLALGFSESISSTFASQQDASLFDSEMEASGGARPSSSRAPERLPVPLENPLSEEASLLRPSLIPGMVAMLAHNLNRDVKDVRLFEQGHIFTRAVLHDSPNIDAVQESAQLSLGLTGNPLTSERYVAQFPLFYELKGAIESLLSLFDLSQLKAPDSDKESFFRPEAAHFAAAVEKPAVPSAAAIAFLPEAPAWLQPGRSGTALLHNQPIAYFGELAYSQREARKLRQPVFLAQLDLARLYELSLKRATARDLSRFQAVERDFSFTFPDTMQWHTIAESIHALNIPELQRLAPTEIFRDPKGRSVPPAHYALLLRCVFQSHDRTLRDDELTSWWAAIIAALTRLGGVIRAPAEMAGQQ